VFEAIDRLGLYQNEGIYFNDPIFNNSDFVRNYRDLRLQFTFNPEIVLEQVEKLAVLKKQLEEDGKQIIDLLVPFNLDDSPIMDTEYTLAGVALKFDIDRFQRFCDTRTK